MKPALCLMFALPLFLLPACSKPAAPNRTASGPAAAPVRVHPVFLTPISSRSQARPAIQVEILDASEHWLLTAELYLDVQSSRFPNGTRVVLPLNVGEFQGCHTRFVQLPFEVCEGDTLLFNLLDDDHLTSEQEALLLNGCRATGYCIVCAGSVYCPAATKIVAPVIDVAATTLGSAVLEEKQLHPFENMGKAEFHVAGNLPAQPNQANRLTLLNNSNHARVVLKLFGPDQPLLFEYPSN